MFSGSSDPKGRVDLICEVMVPISSVCPCSKEISDFGAHNQRGEVRLAIRFKKFIWIEDIIELVESAASCEVYSVLKRVDEKCVTESGFDNPKFVEDIVRDVAKKADGRREHHLVFRQRRKLRVDSQPQRLCAYHEFVSSCPNFPVSAHGTGRH